MEDRTTPGLYLELSDLTPDEYAASRAPVVRGRAGVTRASWWRNLPERPLPRQLPGFVTLGVYELDESAFTAPDDATDHRGLHYVRTPRPGQGRLTGRPTRGLSLVLISPKDPTEGQALRDWGDFVHINYIAAVGVPGITMITPYEHVDGEGARPRYLHFYEADQLDADSVFVQLSPAVAARYGEPGTPTYDEWAWHPQLVIEYVNSLDYVGELA